MIRYLSGLCVAGLGLCGGGWLIVAAVAFEGGSAGQAERVNLLTGAGLVAVSCAALGCWAIAWRRRLRVDGVLTERLTAATRRQARRSRRGLSRDASRTARLAKRSAREGRRAARRSARHTDRLAAGGVLSSGAGLGSAPGGDEAVTAGPGTGESAVELLSELRAMLVPLLAAAREPASPAPAAAPRQLPRRIPRPWSLPGPLAPLVPSAPLAPPAPSAPSAPPAETPAEGDDQQLAADSEEAWW